jgi:hypothetical protein
MSDRDNPNRGSCLVVPAIDCIPATTAPSLLLCLLVVREGCEWLDHLQQGKARLFSPHRGQC